jgi:hypothetical protein
MNAAWDAFFKERVNNTIEDLAKEGWMSMHDICSRMNIKKSWCIDKMKSDKRFEGKKFKVLKNGTTREMLFFRFKK